MGSMFTQNPSLIQDPPPTTSTSSPPPIPLVLIHDGGGTIFSYYMVGNLGRSVHGIANPRYDTGRAWTGGIPEMARHYLAFVKAAVPGGGPVILGGWSLGGLIALEVARLMADDKEGGLRLVGIVMVDSVCPLVLDLSNGGKGRLRVVQHAVQWSEYTRQETKDKVMWCFAEAMRMLGGWKLPVWKGEGPADDAPPPPRVVLLRATDAVPVVEEGVARVDLHREDRLLGWGGYQKHLVTKVIDIPGHHYNIFHTDETLDATTEAMRRACLDLEGMSYGLGLA